MLLAAGKGAYMVTGVLTKVQVPRETMSKRMVQSKTFDIKSCHIFSPRG